MGLEQCAPLQLKGGGEQARGFFTCLGGRATSAEQGNAQVTIVGGGGSFSAKY